MYNTAAMYVSRQGFRRLVAEALDDLPDSFYELMENVDVVVEEEPPPDVAREFEGLLLGLYQGVPLSQRGVADFQLPDKISIYRRNILRVCRTTDEVREQVRQTVLHEIGHHFGLDEDQLEDAGY